jgi:hypothetical protein
MYMEQSLRKLLSQECHRHVIFQKINFSVILVYFKLPKKHVKVIHIYQEDGMKCQTNILK